VVDRTDPQAEVDPQDDVDPDGWSGIAAGWAELWGGVAEPVWRVVARATGIGAGSRVLDVGCGSGDGLAYVARLGASVAGADPAPGMVALARARVPGADVRAAAADRLPWPDGAADVVTAVNVLHLTLEPSDAVAEMVRVAAPGGYVAVAGWGEAAHNDLDTIERAVAASYGERPPPDDGLRLPGGPAALLRAGGLHVVADGDVDVAWTVPDDATLLRGVLLGEDDAVIADLRPAVAAAARPFRTAGGGYRLGGVMRYAVARTAGRRTAG